MAKITVDRQHQLGLETATERVKAIEPNLREKYGVVFLWRGNQADLKGKGVTGTVDLTDNSLSLNLKLGLLLRPLAGKIQASIERKIDAALEGEA